MARNGNSSWGNPVHPLDGGGARGCAFYRGRAIFTASFPGPSIEDGMQPSAEEMGFFRISGSHKQPSSIKNFCNVPSFRVLRMACLQEWLSQASFHSTNAARTSSDETGDLIIFLTLNDPRDNRRHRLTDPCISTTLLIHSTSNY